MLNIILILFAFVIAQAAGDPSVRQLAALHPGKPGGMLAALSAYAALVAVFTLLGLAFRIIMARRLKARPDRTEATYGEARTLSSGYKGLMLTLYFVMLTPLNWYDVSEMAAPPERIIFAHFLLKLLPFLVMLFISWLIYYHVERLFSFRSWTLGQYLSFQVRQTLVVMIPLLGFNFLFEAVERLRGIQEYLALYQELILVAFVPVMAAIYTLIPILARFLWTVESFPMGHLRGRLEELSRRAGVRIRDILLWRTGRASIINAAVLGLFGRYRYVIITDGLLRHLSDSEVEAVFGHELGHAKHRHIAIYAAFLIVISFATMFIMRPLATGNGIIDRIAEVALTFGIFIGLVFGFISRRFERQADMFGCKMAGDTMVFVNALEKVALYSGNARNLRSWMHSSIDKRVKFLIDAMYHPEIGERFQGFARMMARGIVAIFIACLVWAGANFFIHPYKARLLAQAEDYRKALSAVKTEQDRLPMQLALADLYERAGNYAAAAYYYDAVFKDPEIARGMMKDMYGPGGEKAAAKDLRETGRQFLDKGFPETAAAMVLLAVEFDRENSENAPLASDVAKAYMDGLKRLMADGARERSLLDVSAERRGRKDNALQTEAAHALRVFDLAASLAPDKAEEQEMLARGLLISGRYANALGIYRTLVQTAPSPENVIWCGVAEGFAGDIATAQEMLFARSGGITVEDAKRGLLEEARRRVALRYSLSRSTPLEMMRMRFAEWGSMDADSPRFSHFYDAETLYAGGKNDAAVSAYLAAIGAFPENAYYRFRLGEVYLALGEKRKAIEQFTQAVLINRARGEYLRQLALALRIAGVG